MIVERFPNLIYTSNTFKISIGNSIWLIDIGNAKPIIDSLKKDEIIKGVFITHAHYDHIHGINDIGNLFPGCIFFGSDYTIKALYDIKLNLSFYHEDPIRYLGTSTKVLKDKDELELSLNKKIKVLETPGHNPGSLTFILEDYLFTGDSLIPGYPVVTKLKGGSKVDNVQSLDLIFNEINSQTIICPGHGEIATSIDVKREDF